MKMTFFASLESGKSLVGELERYLLCLSSAGMDLLHNFPHIKKLSIKMNTGLPASATCERLFSHAGLLFTAKRSQLHCRNFESQLLLKIITHITEWLFGENVCFSMFCHKHTVYESLWPCSALCWATFTEFMGCLTVVLPAEPGEKVERFGNLCYFILWILNFFMYFIISMILFLLTYMNLPKEYFILRYYFISISISISIYLKIPLKQIFALSL